MKIGDTFKSLHGSKWTVSAVDPQGVTAHSSDGVGYRFEEERVQQSHLAKLREELVAAHAGLLPRRRSGRRARR